MSNNARIINIFSNDNSNVANIKTQYHQIMTTIENGILKFEPMINKSIVANYTCFTVFTFNNNNSFTYINSIVIQHLSKSKTNFDKTQKDRY